LLNLFLAKQKLQLIIVLYEQLIYVTLVITGGDRDLNMNIKSVSDIDFPKRNGLLPVVVQDQKTKDILMLAYANEEAVNNTIKTGNAWFWSTSHNKLWMKGEESGHIQYVKKILVDCDSDALLYLVESQTPACHTGNRSCFHNLLEKQKN
jgi:phosphoribosyl-AMP cyclohydrolase